MHSSRITFIRQLFKCGYEKWLWWNLLTDLTNEIKQKSETCRACLHSGVLSRYIYKLLIVQLSFSVSEPVSYMHSAAVYAPLQKKLKVKLKVLVKAKWPCTNEQIRQLVLSLWCIHVEFFLGSDWFHVLSQGFMEWFFTSTSENQCLLEIILEKGVTASIL